MTAKELSAQYNNQGVDLLEKGRYGDAINVFKNALQTLSKAQKAPPQNRFTEESLYDQSFTQRTPTEKRMDQTLPLRRDENSFIYCCAFRISSSARHEESATASHVQDTMIIIFNMSLVYHFLHLTAPGQSDPKSLSKALNCYTMVQALIMAEENQGMNNDPSILLILIASCNNMGQLQHSVRKFGAAAANMKLLSCTLAFWHTFRYSSLTLDADDLRGFSLNLILLSEEPGLAPAA